MKIFEVKQICIFFWITSCCFFHVSIALQTYHDQGHGSGSSFFLYQQTDYPRDCREVQEKCSSSNSSGVYLIKPGGYLEPFEVYCDNPKNSNGWTVIQRRIDGAIDFNRDWESYTSGFGFLYQEFWLGNEKLSVLTNQKNYQLMIEMTISNGSFLHVSYDNFRISDSFSNYTLVNLEQYSGTADVVTWCHNNMVIENCNHACQRTCENPRNCQEEACNKANACVCPEGFRMKGSDCVPQERCGCYESEGQTVIPEGGFYVLPGCRRKGVCTNGHISWNEIYSCSHNAVCDVRNDTRQCYCNENYIGDGQSCRIPPKDCQEIYDDGLRDSGIYKIKPTGWTGSVFDVYCNMTDGGGWTVFQRRQDGSVNFFLLWDSYKNGFGNLTTDFWLGNDKLYYLTNQKRYQIKIDLVNREYNSYYGKFDFFRINDERDNYRLSGLGTYSGTMDERSTPDGVFMRYHLNYEFSTRDRDNDDSSDNCADHVRAGWWYKSCYYSNLNGDYHAYLDSYAGISCHYIPGPNYNIKYTEMKIRPV